MTLFCTCANELSDSRPTPVPLMVQPASMRLVVTSTPVAPRTMPKVAAPARPLTRLPSMRPHEPSSQRMPAAVGGKPLAEPSICVLRRMVHWLPLVQNTPLAGLCDPSSPPRMRALESMRGWQSPSARTPSPLQLICGELPLMRSLLNTHNDAPAPLQSLAHTPTAFCPACSALMAFNCGGWARVLHPCKASYESGPSG